MNSGWSGTDTLVEKFNSIQAIPNINVETVGARVVGLVDMSIKHLCGGQNVMDHIVLERLATSER
jgi:hypothetical protein